LVATEIKRRKQEEFWKENLFTFIVVMPCASRSTYSKIKKFKLYIWAYFKYLLNSILSVESHKIHISYYVIFFEEENSGI